MAGARTWVCGHRGMVGAALVRRLERDGVEVLTAPRQALDLRDQAAVRAWIAANRPEVIFLAAAKVGGILANRDFPADFLYENLLIETNVIGEAFRAGVPRLMFLGSSCIYPKLAPQPLVEESLLTGPLEPTNEAYAIAKIAGLKLCQALRAQHGADYVSVMPSNLYGPGDNFSREGSHVLPALILKVHEAKARDDDAVEIWGTGTPRREFLHVDDLADACVHVMGLANKPDWLNVGVGDDVAISELATMVAEVVGFRGGFRYDATKPDGTPRKVMDVGRLGATGWRASIGLREGLRSVYAWFLDEQRAGRLRQ